MLELKKLTKVFGSGSDKFIAVDHIDLSIEKGQFVVLIGPSGCGKTTTLKMINHLVEKSSGDILINGESTDSMDVVELRRNIGYVIQSIGLLPHLTIANNVEIVPKLKKIPKAKRSERTRELMDMVGLDPSIYADRYPAELSGGQQQRVGVLRALAAEPDLILMDEPFGALDPITRDQLQEEMKDLQKRLNKTIVFVTHDMDEALAMADVIVLMKDGHIVQAASPDEMLRNPANEFVREFIGEDRLAPQPDTTPVSDIMVSKPMMVEVSDKPREVLNRMKKTNTDIAVVRKGSGGRVLGTVTADRIQRQSGRAVSIEEVTNENVVTVRGNTTVRDAAAKLASDTRVLIVVDRQNRPVGMVSRAWLLQSLVELWDDTSE